MKKPQPIQITITKPCHEKWDNMTPQEQGRFCSACQKCVIDFRNYTDDELYNFLNEHRNEKMCGKFSSSQLNRKINFTPQPNSNIYKWIMAPGVVLALSLIPNSNAFAQAPYTYEQPLDIKEEKGSNTEVDSILITGKVTEYHDAPEYLVATLYHKKKILTRVRVGYDAVYRIYIDPNAYSKKLRLKVTGLSSTTEWIDIPYSDSLKESRCIKLKDTQLEFKVESTIGIIVIENDPPLLDHNNSGNNRTFKGEEIDKMPMR